MAPTPQGRSRAAMLYFVFNAEVVAVLVAHDLRVGEFVAQVLGLTLTLNPKP